MASPPIPQHTVEHEQSSTLIKVFHPWGFISKLVHWAFFSEEAGGEGLRRLFDAFSLNAKHQKRRPPSFFAL